MAGKGTKAARIMELGARGLSIREIARSVSGRDDDSAMSYVRVVLRQRRGRGESESERAYRRRRYHTDPEYREKRLAWDRAYYHRKRIRPAQASGAVT